MASGSREVDAGDRFSPDFDGEETKVAETVIAEAAGDSKEKSGPGDKGAPGELQTKTEAQEPEDGPWLPIRVQKALEKSRSFDEFRKSRPFRFLHLFSGEKDQLG